MLGVRRSLKVFFHLSAFNPLKREEREREREREEKEWGGQNVPALKVLKRRPLVLLVKVR
jgi:hypothetical protein